VPSREKCDGRTQSRALFQGPELRAPLSHIPDPDCVVTRTRHDALAIREKMRRALTDGRRPSVPFEGARNNASYLGIQTRIVASSEPDTMCLHPGRMRRSRPSRCALRMGQKQQAHVSAIPDPNCLVIRARHDARAIRGNATERIQS